MKTSAKQEDAKAIMAKHRWADALLILLDDASENPDDGWTCLYIGSCYYEMRDSDKAREWFERAKQLMPDDPTPLGSLGDVAHLIGDAVKAGEFCQEALAMDPEDELAQKNWQRWLTIENKRGESGPRD
jgi:tetratricopeptide (TPR) repeat protein